MLLCIVVVAVGLLAYLVVTQPGRVGVGDSVLSSHLAQQPSAGLRVRGSTRDHHVDRGESILAVVTGHRADPERLAALRTHHGFRPVTGRITGVDEEHQRAEHQAEDHPRAHAARLARRDPPAEECRHRPYDDEHEQHHG